MQLQEDSGFVNIHLHDPSHRRIHQHLGCNVIQMSQEGRGSPETEYSMVVSMSFSIIPIISLYYAYIIPVLSPYYPNITPILSLYNPSAQKDISFEHTALGLPGPLCCSGCASVSLSMMYASGKLVPQGPGTQIRGF